MQRKNFVVAAFVVAITTMLVAPSVAGFSLEPVGAAVPAAPKVVDEAVSPAALGDRYVPRTAGVEKDMTFFFGPFVVPAGQDRNLVTVDLPVHNGFIVKIAPNLVDAATGEEPSDLDMHIHHAHWFRVSNDPGDEYYTLNLAWVFGTGEEKTQGSLNERSAAEPDGPRYGLYIPGGQPQAMIFMLHNKGTASKTMYITLETRFVYGTADEIKSAEGCPVLMEDEVCSAGATFHALKGRLWGNTFDVPRDFADAENVYVYPRDIATNDPVQAAKNALGSMFVAPYAGTVVASAGHLHPNGKRVIVANLGPAGSGCDADLDNDGFPGTTLYYSDKIDRFPEAGFRSEEYQMGATKMGYRAPVRAGDRITQFSEYENGQAASYEAMSYVGIYIDRERTPAPVVGSCDLDEMKPYLVDQPGAPLAAAQQTIVNHDWHHEPMPYCGFGSHPACDRPLGELPQGDVVDTIHMAGFAYVPGDQNVDLGGGIPRVVRGAPLLIVNEDAAAGIRHTVTTCPWPCNGPYVGNYPQPDGLLDTGKLGNTDYIDGGLTGDDTMPYVELETSGLEPGYHAFYCRVHPTMRGWMEVVEG